MTIVILAAGASRRFGRQKLLERVGDRSLIVHALVASSAWPTVVVASEAVAAEVAAYGRAGVRIVRNDAPERGITRSLAIANAEIDKSEPIAVLLGDLPDCDAGAMQRVIGCYDGDADIVVPRGAGRYGHPVVFGPRARARIDALPDGDGLHRLRDDVTLRRRVIEVADASTFADIDTLDDLRARG